MLFPRHTQLAEKIESPVLLTVTSAIPRTLVMPKDFLTCLIHSGAGSPGHTDQWLLIN